MNDVKFTGFLIDVWLITVYVLLGLEEIWM